ncbi:MAG: hypothetical protein EHM60_03170 [Lysobacterales bacterium]|nr:MAG: hypothetical protein EHM60_03170 [Xanthomonadales bacterium]
MNLLRASILAALAMSVTVASAQSSYSSIEERLRQLETEQAAMKQQLAERDAVIEELKRELQSQAGPAAAVPTPATEAPGAAPATQAPVVVAGAAEPQAEEQEASRTPTPRTVETWGVYDPGTGFLVGRNDYGELSISTYAMARYMSQHDDDQVFTDHLGNERPVDVRSDLFSHRIMMFLKGWMGSEKLIYNVTFWTVNTTDQDAIFANLGYQFSRKFSLYAGLAGNPGSRSLSGSHPYWLGHDRVMADEFFRPFFGSGIYATGEALPGLWYTATVSNNNSALGVKASQLDRKYTYGGTVWWMPTTHEFGPRGAYGDWEWHEELATRFGMSYVDSPEQSFRDSGDSPENTTLRLADSVNLFETGALAPGVTIDEADYEIVALDAGVKYRGMFLQAEYYSRTLDNFLADGLLPVREIKDTGFYVQGSFYPIKQKLEVYGLTSQIYGDDDAGFGDSSEYGLGMNWYPYPTRNHRLNLQLLDVNKSPVSSTFGYYTGGQDGWTLASSFSVFF